MQGEVGVTTWFKTGAALLSCGTLGWQMSPRCSGNCHQNDRAALGIQGAGPFIPEDICFVEAAGPSGRLRKGSP